MDPRWHEPIPIACYQRRRIRHIIHVEYEIAYLAEKLILVHIPLAARPTWDVGVRIDQCDPGESVAAVNRRWVVGITDELRVVVLDDG